MPHAENAAFELVSDISGYVTPGIQVQKMKCKEEREKKFLFVVEFWQISSHMNYTGLPPNCFCCVPGLFNRENIDSESSLILFVLPH